MERLQVLLCATDRSYLHVIRLEKCIFIYSMCVCLSASCYYVDEWL